MYYLLKIYISNYIHEYITSCHTNDCKDCLFYKYDIMKDCIRNKKCSYDNMKYKIFLLTYKLS